MVKEIKGIYREKIEKWYEEFKIKIENNVHYTKVLPEFKNVNFYVNSDLIHFAICPENLMRIEIGEIFLKAFGDKEDCVKFMFTHEFCHFLVLGHKEDFGELMRQAGYMEKWLWEYIYRKYNQEFYISRCNGEVKNLLNENEWCIK